MQPGEQTYRFSRRHKQLLVGSSIAAAGAYFAYRVYKSDSLAALADLRARVNTGLDCYSKAFLAASESSSTVLQDLQRFLTSDSDEVPQSLRQLAKLAKSKDVTDATTLLAAAAVQGVLNGGGSGAAVADGGAPRAPERQILDRIMDALTSERGTSLVTLAVSMACRSSVQAMYEFGGSINAEQPSWLEILLSFGTSPSGERLYSTCVGAFVREGMKVYMGSMDGVNAWEDFFGSLCKPEMQPVLERLTRVFVNELVVSYVKRSRYTAAAAQRGQGPIKTDVKLLKTGSARHVVVSPSVRQTSSHSLAAVEGVRGDGSVCAIAASTPKEASHKLRQPEEVHPEDIHASASNASSWLPLLAQAARQPEVRGLLVSLAGTATAEGVRSSVLTAKDLLTGGGEKDARMLSVATSRQLGALLLCLLLPILLYVAGTRSVLL